MANLRYEEINLSVSNTANMGNALLEFLEKKKKIPLGFLALLDGGPSTHALFLLSSSARAKPFPSVQKSELWPVPGINP